MRKKARMGSDPLNWIKDSREEQKPEESKQSKQGLHSLHSKHNLQSKQELQSEKFGPPASASARVSPKTSQEGLTDGWTRATFIVREDHLDKLKALAYWERKQIKEMMDEILGAYLEDKKIDPIKKN